MRSTYFVQKQEMRRGRILGRALAVIVGLCVLVLFVVWVIAQTAAVPERQWSKRNGECVRMVRFLDDGTIRSTECDLHAPATDVWVDK